MRVSDPSSHAISPDDSCDICLQVVTDSECDKYPGTRRTQTDWLTPWSLTFNRAHPSVYENTY